MQAILVLQVDGHESDPVGVFKDVEAAAEAVLQQERELTYGGELDEEQEDQFRENLRAADNVAVSRGEGHDPIDMQFESGFGSYDYRFVTVEVVR